MSLSRSRVFPSVCLTATRLLLAAWVGGAALFVLTSVAEQTSPRFDSVARDQLATIRFPYYYGFAGMMLGAALGAQIAGFAAGIRGRRGVLVLVLTLLSAGGAALDYWFVYRPLQALIEPPGKPRTQEFVTLHHWSRHANEVHVTLALVAAILACIPAHAAGPAGLGSGAPPMTTEHSRQPTERKVGDRHD